MWGYRWCFWRSYHRVCKDSSKHQLSTDFGFKNIIVLHLLDHWCPQLIFLFCKCNCPSRHGHPQLLLIFGIPKKNVACLTLPVQFILSFSYHRRLGWELGPKVASGTVPVGFLWGKPQAEKAKKWTCAKQKPQTTCTHKSLVILFGDISSADI